MSTTPLLLMPPKPKTKWRTFHMCQSIEGPLLNWKAVDWKRFAKCCTDSQGRRMNADQVKREFLAMHAKGWKVMPIGKACEGFSYQTGCPGHDMEEEEAS